MREQARLTRAARHRVLPDHLDRSAVQRWADEFCAAARHTSEVGDGLSETQRRYLRYERTAANDEQTPGIEPYTTFAY